MSNPNEHDIKVLNGLIRTTLDNAESYRDAAAETDSEGHRDLFERRSYERRHVAEELQEDVRRLGGEPKLEGSLLAKAQRALTDAQHALLRDELTVVGAVEGRESLVRARFEQALDDSHVSATTRESIRRAYARLTPGRDQLHEMKRNLESQRDNESGLFPH